MNSNWMPALPQHWNAKTMPRRRWALFDPVQALATAIALSAILALPGSPAIAQDKRQNGVRQNDMKHDGKPQPPLSSQAKNQKSATPSQSLSAEETLSLDFVSDVPADSLAVSLFETQFRPELERRLRASGSKSKLELSIRHLAAAASKNTSGKQPAKKAASAFQEIRSASADGGLVNIGTQPANLPLLQAPWNAPFLSLDAASLVRVLGIAVDQVPEIRQSFLSKNQILLALTAGSEFVLVSKFELKDFAGLKSRKIGVPAAATGWLADTGANVMQLDHRAAAQALAAGTVDALIMPLDLVLALKVTAIAPFVIRTGFGSMPGPALTVNKHLWDDLKPDERDVLSSAGLFYQQAMAKAAAAQEKKLLEKIAAMGGKVSSLPLRERQAWAAALPDLAKRWPAQIKKTGKPAALLMDIYLQAAMKAGAQPARDWAR
jgi:TRAP-type C4-dicarboxylate transport system substrate-binding protein